MKAKTKDAYVEVLGILDLLDEEQKNRIPKKLKEFFENNKNQDYQVNIDSNISKYALENSRVYVDVAVKGNEVTIQLKNTSKDKLNISADELMQRFVRGETSRNTEGSGLGLSIATSLTELQGGKFSLYLDGDLFKVTINLSLAQ